MDFSDLEWSNSLEPGPKGIGITENPEGAPPDTADRYMAQMLARLPQGGGSGASLSSEAQVGDTTRLLSDPRDLHVFSVLQYHFDTTHKPTFQPGQSIGRYIVLEELGAGAMGAVYKAYDAELDRAIAIKLLHTEGNEDDTARFQREAQALAKLSHPNVIQVHDVGVINGQTFIAMELVKGQTLREWMEEPDQPRPWRDSVNAYLQAGAGLAAAHEASLIHRDFKPDNAIIDTKGQVRVLDFGLARRATDTMHGPIDDRPADLSVRDLALEVSLTSLDFHGPEFT
ncbi:MAG: serine/threonine-protein kinase [Myxococcota bacterium]